MTEHFSYLERSLKDERRAHSSTLGVLRDLQSKYDRLKSRAEHGVHKLQRNVSTLRRVVSAAGKTIQAMAAASTASLQTLVEEVQATPDARILEQVLTTRDRRPDAFMRKVCAPKSASLARCGDLNTTHVVVQ